MVEVNSCSSSLTGIIDDIKVNRIKHPKEQLRTDSYNVSDLSASIKQKGLLQPIVVRMKEDYFEIVAGNRRFKACKNLGWRKITCLIEELDDMEAFEISLMENIQRHTLNPIDEATAYNTYVSNLGWGAVSDLATKIGKSVSYVTKRMALLDLPPDVIDSIRRCVMSSSVAEELCGVRDETKQTELAYLIAKRHLTVRKVRHLVKNLDEENQISHLIQKNPLSGDFKKYFDKVIIVLKIALKKLGRIIEDAKNHWWVGGEILLQHKFILEEQIDFLLKEKRKLNKKVEKIAR